MNASHSILSTAARGVAGGVSCVAPTCGAMSVVSSRWVGCGTATLHAAWPQGGTVNLPFTAA